MGNNGFSATDYDVIVAGGGPAGATAATLAAQAGHSVLLLEKSAEPVHKVGESLMPATYWILQRLGVLEKMRGSAFPKKYSVQFFGPDGRGFSPFYFRENDPHECSQTWQVLRRDFDQMLLDNAAEKGVEVRRGASLREVVFDGEQLTAVEASAGDNGETAALGCKVLVDATGQRAFLARKLGLLEVEPTLKNASFFTHFDGARRDEGVDEGATLIMHTQRGDSWFWFIPMPGDRVSVGVVGPVERLLRGRSGEERKPQEIFDREMEHCPAIRARLEGARQARPMGAIRDFSYRSRQIAGPGWVLVGDAFSFIDPIYSTGVFLALASGEMAADSVIEALATDDLSSRRLGAFEERYRQGLEALRKLVYAYYDPNFSFATFLKRYPDLRRDLINMLVGNVYREPTEHLVAALDEMMAAPASEAIADRSDNEPEAVSLPT